MPTLPSIIRITGLLTKAGRWVLDTDKLSNYFDRA